MRNIIVLDTANKPFLENKIFNPDVASRYPGGMFLVAFYKEAISRGFEVVTCDQVSVKGLNPKETILVTEEWTPLTASLIMRGALPGIVFSDETLWHAWRFYSNLGRISRIYRHVFVFNEASKWVDSRFAVHHTEYFPQPYCAVLNCSGLAWEYKQYMVILNSAIPAPSGFAYKRACKMEPALANDLYDKRLQWILHIANRDGFHVYGRGWNSPHTWISDELRVAVGKCYQGECKYENKVTLISNYRFALCIENTSLEGYITEKIFDCFFAGTIPIYCGPPDIDKYVPKDAYIAFDDFESYEALELFLDNLRAEQADVYLKAAADYLASPQYAHFYQDNVAQKKLDIIEGLAKEEMPKRNIGLTIDLLIVFAKFAIPAIKSRFSSIVRNLLKIMIGR